MIVRAGLSGFPYLSRRREWKMASGMLEQTTSHDGSPATLAVVLPPMRSLVRRTAGNEQELSIRGILARTLAGVGEREEAEQEFRAIMKEAESGANSGPRQRVRPTSPICSVNTAALMRPWAQSNKRRITIAGPALVRGRCLETNSKAYRSGRCAAKMTLCFAGLPPCAGR